MPKCIICGSEKENGKRDCGKHTYEEYKKTKSLVWNDPWPYFGIYFGGFVATLLGIASLVPVDWNEDQVMVFLPILIGISLCLPTTIGITLHYFRQKRKELPFWGLTDDQEYYFVNDRRTES